MMKPGITRAAFWWLKFAVLWSFFALLLWTLCHMFCLGWSSTWRLIDLLTTNP
jgi:hypothetical protein